MMVLYMKSLIGFNEDNMSSYSVTALGVPLYFKMIRNRYQLIVFRIISNN